MTIDWRYTGEGHFGILSVAGHLGPDAVRRFTGAVGWALARASGPVVVDLTELRGWSAEGQLAIAEAARRLEDAGCRPELAAIPADGSLVPTADGPPIPVHSDLSAALAVHSPERAEQAAGRRAWRTTRWPAADQTGE